MAANIFAFWSDRLGDRTFDHHGSKGDGAFASENCPPAGPVFDQFFQMSVLAREGMLVAGIDSHITRTTRLKPAKI